MRTALSVGTLALGAALLYGMPVSAIAQEDSGQIETTAIENPNEQICRRVHVTGSNIPQRICMTRAEWMDLREETVSEVREVLDNGEQSTAQD